MQPSLHSTKCDLMDVVIIHLDQLAQTGCVRAGLRASLLLNHIADDPEDDGRSAMLRRLLEHLRPSGDA